MLPCLLFLVFGMVGGETCDVVFQDSTHAKASVKECITSMMQDFVRTFELEIDQLKYAYQKQERQYQQLRTESTERVDIIDRLKIELDNMTLENGYMKNKLDFLSKAAYLQRNKRFERSVLTPRTPRTPITDVPWDLSPSAHAPARSIISPSGDSEITPVAFHALLAHNVLAPGNDQELSFEHVITNTGNSYSKNTGAFTAFQPGTYVFTWEITATANHYIDTHLIKNGDVVGSIKSWGYYTSGSTSSGTVVLDLDSRDEVLVRVGDHTAGVDVLATYTMFSGFRLF